jgi:hypothetical protein
VASKQETNLSSIKNPFVKKWLNFVDGSESPEIFNLWTGLSAVAACLGRRSSIVTGRIRLYPNMYVILVGPAAVRKSSTASIVKEILKRHTPVKFGPDDTAGMRQGLIAAFLDAYGTREKSVKAKISDDIATIFAESVATEKRKTEIDELQLNPDMDASEKAVMEQMLLSSKSILDMPKKKYKHEANENVDHDLFIFSDELSDFIGMNQSEMTGCLTSLYYPKDDYIYKLSQTTTRVNRPGLNILACTTPTSLMKHLPEVAIGQGFSSRTMFVYAGRSRGKVFIPKALDQETSNEFGRLFNTIFTWNVEFTRDANALFAQEKIYLDYKLDIVDTRFANYEQRRDMHLTKLTMVLAAARGSTVISHDDVIDAQLILEETEKEMHLSLGELGINKASLAKQHMREVIEASWPIGVSVNMLRSNAMRDMTTKTQFQEALDDLCQKGVCMCSEAIENGQRYSIVIPKMPESKGGIKTGKARRSEIELNTLAS